MKLKIIFIVLTITLTALPQSSEDQCLNCHSVIGDELQKPADLYGNDVHYSAGILCSDCHGGDASSEDPEISMSKEKGFIGVPERKERYLACIKCHSDAEIMKTYKSKIVIGQFDELKNSVHFKPTFDNKGPIADCVSCHQVHNIKKVTDPSSPVHPLRVVQLCGSCHSDASFMKNYNPSLPVDQVAKYRTSTHGERNRLGDPNAAECVSCHGSHEIMSINDSRSFVYPTNIPQVCSGCHSSEEKMRGYKIPTNQFALFKQSVHGVALLEKGDLSAPSCNDCHGNHGATPPGVESISKVCGSCHALNMELFEKSVHKTAFDKAGIPECESCHGNHKIKAATDELLGTGESSSCTNCHEEGDRGFTVARTMKMLVDSLKMEEREAKRILEEAERIGMDVSDAKFAIKDTRQILIQSRTAIHLFDLDDFTNVISSGFEVTSSVKTEGLSAIEDYYFRRQGLVISTLIVTLLSIGLFIKIKRLEKRDKEKENKT